MVTILTPFRASHLEGIVDLPQARAFEGHPSKTVWDPQGQVIACYGCVIASPGRGVLWLVRTPQVAGHLFGVVRWFLYDLRKVCREYGLWRVEMVVDPTNHRAVALVQYLGFEREVEMRGYASDGSSREQWVWLREKERVNDR